LTTWFKKKPDKGIDIEQMIYARGGKEVTKLRSGMSQSEILSAMPDFFKNFPKSLFGNGNKALEWVVVRNRCFLELALRKKDEEENYEFRTSPGGALSSQLRDLIHLPGLRGNPERDYPLTAVGTTFPGTFEHYTASVIAQWQSGTDNINLKKISKDLEKLGLTWKVTAKPVNDTQVEIQVGRLNHAAKGGAHDLVSIADVGLGVSQTLPVVVALQVAEPNQTVYLEQPEIHLHPRAQTAMAQVLADAALRGVRVVAETHSSLLLLGIQTLVAEGRLPPELVKLHWFTRGDDGMTEIRSADLDEAGAFGDWPEDFAEVSLKAQSRYLDAAEARLMESGDGIR